MVLVTIIIPSYNRGSFLKETLASIKDQRHQVSYEILLIDNMSTDCTMEIVSNFGSLPIVLFRERDAGIYSAVAKGIQKSSGEYVCYINCGDLFDPYFFATITNVKKQRPRGWYIGLPTSRGDDYTTNHIRGDFYTSSRLIRMGYHNGIHEHFLQQESIFWHRRFNDEIDLSRLSAFRLAGDAYMWLRFARVSEPVLLGISISGYTHHANPLSGNKEAYMQEFSSLYEKKSRPLLLLFLLLALSAAKKVNICIGRIIILGIKRIGR